MYVAGAFVYYSKVNEAMKCEEEYGSTCPQMLKDYLFQSDREDSDGAETLYNIREYIDDLYNGMCYWIILEQDEEPSRNCEFYFILLTYLPL